MPRPTHATTYKSEKHAFGKPVRAFKPNTLQPRRIPGVIQALDGFAGAGGFSQALFRLCRSMGYEVDHRIFNHWSVALDVARKNLGNITVYNGAIQDLDPREVVPSGYLDIALFSPECIYFSAARGARPINDQRRSTAGEILRFLEEIYIETVVLENVEEIQRWGGLDKNYRPIKSKEGELYRAFIKAIENLGYNVKTFCLTAADYGDPTTRRRWYLIAQRDQRPIRCPQQTHSKNGAVPDTLPWVSARDIIDFATKGNSIFSRPSPHSTKTSKRIRIGFDDQVARAPLAQGYVGALDRFIEVADLYHAQVANLPSEKLLGRRLTRDEKALVRDVKQRAQAEHQLLVEQIFETPVGHFTWEQLLLRNGIEPALDGERHLLMGTMRGVDPVVTKLYGTTDTSDLDAPLDSLTAGGKHFGVASPTPDHFLVPPNHGVTEGSEAGRHSSVDAPLETITSKNSHGLVEPVILRANASDTSAWNDAITPIDDPLRTVTGKNNLSVVVPDSVLLPQQTFGNDTVRSLGEPLPTITTISRNGLAQPTVSDAGKSVDGFISSYYGPKGDTHRAPRSLDQPLATQTGDNTFAFVEPAIVNLKGRSTATPSSEPLPTQTAHAAHFYLAEPAHNVDAVLVSQHMTYNDNPSLDEPMVTASTRGAGYIAQPFLVSRHQQHTETDNRTRRLDEPMATATGSGAGYLVDPVLIPQHRGVDSDSVDRPIRTLTARNGNCVAFPLPEGFVTPNFGERETQRPRTHSLEEPLPTVTGHGAGMLVQSDAAARTRGKPFVTIGGTIVELDILYRMLNRDELLRAHSLKTKEHEFDTKGCSEATAVKLVGNGVAVSVAMSLISEALRYRFDEDRAALGTAA